jgi:N-dimethylarginine dimethylaminohydrolase
MEVTSRSHASLSEVGRLASVAVKDVRDAFIDERTIAAQWQALHFTGAPDLGRALAEQEEFFDVLRTAGAELRLFPRDPETTLDSLYARDASIVSPHGVIVCRMGKQARGAEPDAQQRAFEAWGVPVAGRIEAPGTLEGGDVIWLDDRTMVVGRGYRTNGAGIRQLRALLGPTIEVIEVPLPHWRGDTDVMHLMSLVSPVDADLAVVYSPLLPVPFREFLLERGCRLVEVPPDEFDSMGTNVLALAPRRCLMVSGNPTTRRLLETAGADVIEYAGEEISAKGAGGPTCLTRPLART